MDRNYKLTTYNIMIIITIIAVTIIMVILKMAMYRYVFTPTKGRPTISSPMERYSIKTPDGELLYALLYRNTNGNKITIYAYGNTGNVKSHIHKVDVLKEFGSVVMFDYRGYGGSTGKPSEEGFYKDIKAVWKWVLNMGYTPDDIILYGESLGCAVVSELTRDLYTKKKIAPKLLILQSGPTSLRDIYPKLIKLVANLLPYKFDTLDNLKHIKNAVPIMVVHSPDDEVVDMTHAAKMLLVDKDIYYLRIRGGHSTPIFGECFYNGVKKLIK